MAAFAIEEKKKKKHIDLRKNVLIWAIQSRTNIEPMALAIFLLGKFVRISFKCKYKQLELD